MSGDNHTVAATNSNTKTSAATPPRKSARWPTAPTASPMSSAVRARLRRDVVTTYVARCPPTRSAPSSRCRQGPSPLSSDDRSGGYVHRSPRSRSPVTARRSRCGQLWAEQDSNLEVKGRPHLLKCGECDAHVSGLHAGDGRLAGAHPRRKLALGQTGNLASITNLFTNLERELRRGVAGIDPTRSAADICSWRRDFISFSVVRAISPPVRTSMPSGTVVRGRHRLACSAGGTIGGP